MSIPNTVVDILMATYNGELFVSQQIESILAQDYPFIRLLIRDDVSTDNTRAILTDFAKNHPERIVLLPSEERLGVKGNFSCLMSHSTAAYVMLADQDDVWYQDKISKTLGQMKAMEYRHSTDAPLLVHTDLTVVDQDLKIIAPSFWRYVCLTPPKTNTLNRLLVQPVVTGCSMMMNRPLLKLALPIPSNCVMHDSWIALVAAAFGRIDALPHPTLLYRQHRKNALGAKKFYSLSYWKQGVPMLSESETKKIIQGRELFSRYEHSLGKQQKTLLKAYLSLPQKAFFQRLSVILTHKLFRSGFWRNAIAMLLPIYTDNSSKKRF